MTDHPDRVRADGPPVPDFDRLYAADPDPWHVTSGAYEVRKREIVLAVLNRRDYRQAWDPACGTGHLAERLATVCTAVSATDGSAEAVRLTAALCASSLTVDVRHLSLPDPPTHAPAEGFDLIVLAEFLYYLDAAARRESMRVIRRHAAPGCELLAVHWRYHPHDGWLSGADVQREIGTDLVTAGWTSGVHLDDPDFVIDGWRRPAAPI